MITEKEYKEALNIVKQYESEQIDLINSKRMTIGYFLGRIPVIKGNNANTRLINALLEYESGYLDELKVFDINGKKNMQLRNIGHKATLLFLEYKDKIMNNLIDAYDRNRP
jgi:hypothetical protein